LFKEISLQHGRFFKPDLSKLLSADFHFNPSLTIWNRKLWMVYRCVSSLKGASLFKWNREFAACRLGTDLQPIKESNINVSKRIGNAVTKRRWYADPRFFLRGDDQWISYHDDINLHVFPINLERPPERIYPKPLVLVDKPPRSGERNWGFFDDGAFKAVYSIYPHVVLKLEESNDHVKAFSLNETKIPITWDVKRWGEPHGGSSPVCVGSCWFSFFQSSTSASWMSKRKVYHLGFYGFDANPPHRIRYMTREPILSASSIVGPWSYYRNHAVVFPSGALCDDGWWLVSLGIHDRTIMFAVFEHKSLLEYCATY
jgi:predicted GH43/DUF377 family glycosyl hydrolase